jgi:organic radical activating enzyme
MQISSLIIETTRKCQLRCRHCLRGNAQPKDIKLEYIDDLLSRTERIGSVTFTGGEPTLNPRAIQYFVNRCRDKKVGVGGFYIATNGIRVTNDFLLAVIDLWTLCDDNELSAIELSNDDFHGETLLKTETNRLKVFSFFRNKYEKGHTYEPIHEGRTDYGTRLPKDYGFEIEDELIREGEVYLNVLGEIVSGCDWSYKNQRKHKVCDVADLSLESFIKYGKKGGEI